MDKIDEYNVDDYVYAVTYWDKNGNEHWMTMDSWKQICDFMQKNNIVNYSTRMIKRRKP